MGLYIALTTTRLYRLPTRNRWYIARSDYPRCFNSYEECEAFARQWHKERPLSRYSLIINRYHCERKVMFYDEWYGDFKPPPGLILPVHTIPAR